jgi:hypothetical protein
VNDNDFEIFWNRGLVFNLIHNRCTNVKDYILKTLYVFLNVREIPGHLIEVENLSFDRLVTLWVFALKHEAVDFHI